MDRINLQCKLTILVYLTSIFMSVNGLPASELIHQSSFYVPDAKNCKNVWWKNFPDHRVRSSESATYDENMDCDVHITIRGDPNDQNKKYGINITFTMFEMEAPDFPGGPCPDYLQFFVDDATQIPVTEKLCGYTIPGPFLFNQTHIAFKLVSNNRNQRSGFAFTYDEVWLNRDEYEGNGGSGRGGNRFKDTGSLHTRSSANGLPDNLKDMMFILLVTLSIKFHIG